MSSSSQSFYSETGYEGSISSTESAQTLDLRRSTTQSSSDRLSSPEITHNKHASSEDLLHLSQHSNSEERESRRRGCILGHNLRESSTRSAFKSGKKICLELNKNEFLGEVAGCCKYGSCSLL